jgi:hypothetical protein
MKKIITSASIRKTSSGYTVAIKSGRKTTNYSLSSYNSARSFVRRNFAQKGHYTS